jgi:signal transduction histidine kinase
VEFETEITYPKVGLCWVQVNYMPERDEAGHVVGWVASIVDITKRKNAETALQQLTNTLEDRVRERTRQVRQLASELVTAEKSVRRHSAQLLHHDLQQMLFAIDVQLGFLSPTDSEQEQFAELIGMIRQAVSLTRQLAVELSPPVLDGEGLYETLSWLAQHMADSYQLQVTIEANGHAPATSEEQRISLYQIVRELLFYIVKHAGVQTAQVALGAEAAGFTVTVSDEGQGFDLVAWSNEVDGHFGLRSVQKRLQLLGGRADIVSQLGTGTQITLYLPSGLPDGAELSSRMRS